MNPATVLTEDSNLFSVKHRVLFFNSRLDILKHLQIKFYQCLNFIARYKLEPNKGNGFFTSFFHGRLFLFTEYFPLGTVADSLAVMGLN
jgi:hypothetical protein